MQSEGKRPINAAPLHYAWNDRTKDRQAELDRLGVDSTPQLVRGEPSEGGGAKSPLGTAWNVGGTWEERDVSRMACDLLKQMFVSTHGIGGKEVMFLEPSVAGSVNLVSSRGKLKVGYELDISAAWEVRQGGEVQAKGSLKASIEDSDSDFTAFTPSKSEGVLPTGEAITLLRLSQDPLKKIIKNLWVGQLVNPNVNFVN